MSNPEVSIAVQNITKNFGKFTAVDNLSFEVRPGEIFSMLGNNGAGKTTTIRMILDILKPDSGTITLFGEPISDKTKDRIGYLPEERGLYRNVKVVDVLVYLGRLKGMTGNDARQRANELLDFVDLGHVADQKVNELSRGMQQKVQIITTILHRPELIIVDEPFSGLDPVNTQLIKNLLYQMKDEGVTIMMSTHMMHQVEEMGDRLLMMSQGQRVLYGNVREVRQQFAENAIIVEGSGDWAALDGVSNVEHKNQHVLLHLVEGVDPDTVIQRFAASPDYHVRRFELAIPSLTEIFINVSGEQNLNGGAA
jgi:ABC-2 type transport system ATP-binding protein